MDIDTYTSSSPSPFSVNIAPTKAYFTFETSFLSTIIIVYFLMLILFSIGMMWSAELLETGASFFTGFGLAMRKIRGRVFSLFVGSIIPVSVLFAEACLFAYLNVSFAFVINIVVYLFIYMYYVAFIMVAYYDISGIEREDLKKVNIWKR